MPSFVRLVSLLNGLRRMQESVPRSLVAWDDRTRSVTRPGLAKPVSNLHNRVSPLGVQLWYTGLVSRNCTALKCLRSWQRVFNVYSDRSMFGADVLRNCRSDVYLSLFAFLTRNSFSRSELHDFRVNLTWCRTLALKVTLIILLIRTAWDN